MVKIPEALRIAIAHHRAGRLELAEQLYRQILAVEPEHADTLHLLGLAAHERGDHEAAIVHISRAVRLKGGEAAFHHNLAEAHRALRNKAEARECYRRVVELKPHYPESHYNLALALQEEGNLLEAIASYHRALELRPAYAEAHYNLGIAFSDQGNLDAAADCYRRAVQLRPDHARAHNNLAGILKEQGDLEGAIACYRRTLELRPDRSEARSNLLFALYYCPGVAAATIAAEHRLWNRQHAEPLARSVQPHLNDPAPDRRLRVGYVSADFHEHPLTLVAAPLLAAHDHAAFEIICYSDEARPDAWTDRLRSHADAWRDIREQDDGQVADQVRQDGVDILVDLGMHMPHNRLLVFARKPAPVQITWFAYPGTTGLSAIDYRLTDPYLDPPGLNDEHYSECSVRLPDTFWCYDPHGTEPAVSPLPALAGGRVTFGCLNNFCKVNPQVLALWARVLRAVDRSRLLLLVPEGSPRRRVLDLLAQEGIGAERIQMAGFLGRRPYLELYHRIDIALDTFPYNGHTTSLDGFWMGVPLVTLVGQLPVGRAGLSQLSNLGLPELVAQNADDYVRIAAAWAGDLDRLSRLRATLRARMQGSPLMDAPRFARAVEAAYRQMWRLRCRPTARP